MEHFEERVFNENRMALNLQLHDRVYVPISIDDRLARYDFALYETEVIEKNADGRSVRVNLPNGEISEWIGTSKVRRNSGILIFNIGDFETETALLDPLSKSVLQFCRLLLKDDFIRSVKIRSIDELEWFWNRENAAYRYIILIGHGESNSLKFGVNGWVSADEVYQVLDAENSSEKIFISLCCKTGYRGFAGKLSRLNYCEHFIAPLHELNGAVASQYCQSFLNQHLLYGHTALIAHGKAVESLSNRNLFRVWKNGGLID